MKLRLAALAIFVLSMLPGIAFAQSQGALILPSGCGTANFTYGVGYLTVDPTGRLCDFASGTTSAGASQPQLAVTTGAVVTPTVPAGTAYAVIAVRSGAASSVNYCYDGVTTPTTGAAGSCFQLNAGQTVSISGVSLVANLKFIAATATTAIDIGYTK